MVCKKCRFDFCWVCLGPWEPHGSSWSVIFSSILLLDRLKMSVISFFFSGVSHHRRSNSLRFLFYLFMSLITSSTFRLTLFSLFSPFSPCISLLHESFHLVFSTPLCLLPGTGVSAILCLHESTKLRVCRN